MFYFLLIFRAKRLGELPNLPGNLKGNVLLPFLQYRNSLTASGTEDAEQLDKHRRGRRVNAPVPKRAPVRLPTPEEEEEEETVEEEDTTSVVASSAAGESELREEWSTQLSVAEEQQPGEGNEAEGEGDGEEVAME